MTNTEFSAIVQQYQRLVYTICYQLVQNPHTAQDLAQDTFVSAYTHIDTCPPEHYKAWLARIASNKAKDYLKSAWNRKVSAVQQEHLPESPIPTAQTPEELAITRAELAHLHALIAQLKEPYALVSRMYFIEEQTVDEISRALKRPPKTVHTQLYRARQLLQKQIQMEERRVNPWN